jgi:sulfur dioxygenase
LFDPESSTYTYLLWDTDTKDALLVDPVDIQVDRDLKIVKEMGLNLKYGVNTHNHADHISSTWLLKQKVPNLRSIIPQASKASADVHVQPNDRIEYGNRFLTCRPTPGHTGGSMSYVADNESFVLTGDALLIEGCGRTDLQDGSSDALYDSIHEQIFTLPDDCKVYPAHDYKGRTSSTVGHEKENNPRLGQNKSKDEFVEIMANLDLSRPDKIDESVPVNMRDGQPFSEQEQDG